MVSMSQIRSKGFTLIEILVVIVIIGILATMGIGKYAQFSRDARKSGCVNNQNTIDKGMGMWESKYVAINLKSGNSGALSVQFFMNGKKDVSAQGLSETNGRFPGRFKSTAAGKDDEVYNQIQDETVFICPETANSYSGINNIPSGDKSATSDYKWFMFARGTTGTALNPIGGKLRGTGCLVWGTVATTGNVRNEIETGDGSFGPSGTDEDLHSGIK